MRTAFDDDKLTPEQIQALHAASVAVAKRGPWRYTEVLTPEDGGGGKCEVCGMSLTYSIVMENPQEETISVGAACGRTLVKNQMKVHPEEVLAAHMGEEYNFERAVKEAEELARARSKVRAGERLKAAGQALLNHPGTNDFGRKFAQKAVEAAEVAIRLERKPKWTEKQEALLKKLTDEANTRASGGNVPVPAAKPRIAQETRVRWVHTAETAKDLSAWGIVAADEAVKIIDTALEVEGLSPREAVRFKRYVGPAYTVSAPMDHIASSLSNLMYLEREGRGVLGVETVARWTKKAQELGAITESAAYDIIATKEEKRAQVLRDLEVLTTEALEGGETAGTLKWLVKELAGKGRDKGLLSAQEAESWVKMVEV